MEANWRIPLHHCRKIQKNRWPYWKISQSEILKSQVATRRVRKDERGKQRKISLDRKAKVPQRLFKSNRSNGQLNNHSDENAAGATWSGRSQ